MSARFIIPTAFYGLTTDRLAAVCGVSKRTAARYLSGQLKPSLQVLRLATLYGEERVLEGPWARFRVRGRLLIDPEGRVYSDSVLRGYEMLLQWAHGLAGELGRTDEYYDRYLKVIEHALREVS
jgi:transcriptional regulator with XRE-family HTH domain